MGNRLAKAPEKMILGTKPRAGATGCAISDDGRIAISSHSSRGQKPWTCVVWDPQATGDDKEVKVLSGHKGFVSGCALSRDGKIALTGSFDKTLIVFSLEDGKCQHVLRGHTGRIDRCALSADGRVAASGSIDTNVILWDVKQGEALRTLDDHAKSIRGVSLSADGKVLMTCCEDRCLVWNTDDGEVKHALINNEYQPNTRGWGVFARDTITKREVLCCAVSPDGTVGVTYDKYSEREGWLTTWRISDGSVLHQQKLTDMHLNRISLSSDGSLALMSTRYDPCSAKKCEIMLVATPRGKRLHSFEASYGTNACALSPDGRFALSTEGSRCVMRDLLAGGAAGYVGSRGMGGESKAAKAAEEAKLPASPTSLATADESKGMELKRLMDITPRNEEKER
uniref:Anaphase-promoting complex subunit 4 WD40 domain-containing protein n=1 Tax=Lotharella globosa TaxID=91324 RepID=A0A7S4DY62_9EUKA|mmetsp:Transcript_634/g.1249  ORF Transcript_634/g.1249 Transcript_634/m.1249 type:complete len:397 (+) Transcript_634:71-1261(+)